MSAGGGEGGIPSDQWAWLGLLKWTLNQQSNHEQNQQQNQHQPDFSDARTPPVPMSEEDKEFLERVLKEGIMNEGDRMSEILQEFATAMDVYQKQAVATSDNNHENSDETDGGGVDVDHIQDLLMELRDICEQIDFARAFVNIKGLDYLLGAIQQTNTIPLSIRNTCLMLISTLAQNNPPVQKQLVEMGAIKILSDLFLHEIEGSSPQVEQQQPTQPQKTTAKYLTKLMQAISATVRDYEMTEHIFEQLPQSPLLMVLGLTWPQQRNSSSSNRTVETATTTAEANGSENIGETLHIKTLFLLRAIITSDSATATRSDIFSDAIKAVLVPTLSSSSSSSNTTYYYYVDDHHDTSSSSSSPSTTMLRETSVSLLRQLLERNFATSILMEQKQSLVSLGIRRIATLRKQLQTTSTEEDGNMLFEHDDNKVELHDWETALSLLAKL